MNSSIASKPVFWWLIGAFFIGALSAWWLHTYKRVSKEVDLPLRGAASYNPLYALQKTLEAAGLEVQSHADLRLDLLKLQAHDTLLVEGHIQQLSEADAQKLVAWVHDGGHLLTSLPAAEVLAFSDAFDSDSDEDSDEDSDSGDSYDSQDAEHAETEFVLPGRNNAVLHTLKIQVRESPACISLSISGPKAEHNWCPKSRFEIGRAHV